VSFDIGAHFIASQITYCYALSNDKVIIKTSTGDVLLVTANKNGNTGNVNNNLSEKIEETKKIDANSIKWEIPLQSYFSNNQRGELPVLIFSDNNSVKLEKISKQTSIGVQIKSKGDRAVFFASNAGKILPLQVDLDSNSGRMLFSSENRLLGVDLYSMRVIFQKESRVSG